MDPAIEADLRAMCNKLIELAPDYFLNRRTKDQTAMNPPITLADEPIADNSKVVILDLDNCISDDGWRIPFIDWSKGDPHARFHVYHSLALQDRPNVHWVTDQVHRRLRALDLDPADVSIRYFILTARYLRYREITELWVKKNFPYPVEAILMRNDDDARPSVEVKRQQLSWLLNLHNVKMDDILFAADDQAAILDMYIDEGLDNDRWIPHMIHKDGVFAPPSGEAPAPPVVGPKWPFESADGRPMTVPELLQAASETYATRNPAYGNNYHTFGMVMAGLFPRSLQISEAEEWNRLAILVMLVSKISRYCANFAEGGHVDSARDAIVYAAMLEELTRKRSGEV